MNNDKNRLIKRLTDTHSEIQNIIEGIDLDLQVYTETDWRIRDILGHIATWDREITKAIQAYMEGGEFVNPEYSGDENNFNEREVIKQRKLTTEEILAEWEQAREELKQALTKLPDDKFPGEFEFPWGGERGSVAQLVEYFIEHDMEHLNEIKSVL